MGSIAQESVLLLSNTCTEQFTFTLGSEQDVLYKLLVSLRPGHCLKAQAACSILLKAAICPSTWAAELNVQDQYSCLLCAAELKSDTTGTCLTATSPLQDATVCLLTFSWLV